MRILATLSCVLLAWSAGILIACGTTRIGFRSLVNSSDQPPHSFGLTSVTAIARCRVAPALDVLNGQRRCEQAKFYDVRPAVQDVYAPRFAGPANRVSSASEVGLGGLRPALLVLPALPQEADRP